MPLTHIRLQNFKCFHDSGTIPLAPLTLVFGRNNTGKSSILQSLLLLRQTLDSPEFGARLQLRGPLFLGGSYVDLVHKHLAKQNIVFEFGVTTEEVRNATLTLEFRSDEPQPPRLLRLRVAAPGVDSLEIRTGRGAGGPYELAIAGKGLGGEKGPRAGFLFPPNRLLPFIDTSRSASRSRTAAAGVLSEFSRVLRDLRAVGAFRQRPERRYEYQGRVPDTIDATGQYVVNALIEDSTRRGSRRGQLVEAVNGWLKQVGRVRLMPFRRISKTARLFEIRVKDTDSGRWANFADVGFGIGQAFPVIVEGLRTPPHGTFLVQEPEIHLHPDAQLSMGSFLLELSRSSRQVVAETHSENLLLRVRRLVAQRDEVRPEDVSVVHVVKTRDGRSHAQSLALDGLGQVKSWPEGFMEEATDERIALLAEAASRAEVESRGGK